MLRKTEKLIVPFLLAFVVTITSSFVGELEPAYAAGAFSNFEIRVVRPRYFSKRKRLELGSNLMIITNDAFIYTYMLSGVLTYHLSEQLAVEGVAAIGQSIDKEDKSILEDVFNINTLIIRTKSLYAFNGLWTPIYGKYQLGSGRLIYFDTFLTAGAGLSGVSYQFDHCSAGDENNPRVIPGAKVVNYPTFSFGLGQRFFISKHSSLKWGIKDHLFGIDTKDGSCFPETAESQSKTHQNVTVQLGYSRFF